MVHCRGIFAPIGVQVGDGSYIAFVMKKVNGPAQAKLVVGGPCHRNRSNSRGCPVQALLGRARGRTLPHGWNDTCLLSPPRRPLRLDFYPTRLTICVITEAAPGDRKSSRLNSSHLGIS